jgi:large conductance mechanosensitive channel
MGMLAEFKEFAIKGNAMDLAVGLIIGAEFGKIVNSLVADVIMPFVGLFLGGVDFKNFFIALKKGASAPDPTAFDGGYTSLAVAQADKAATMNIGVFITTTISFVIIAFAVFMIVKGLNKLKGAPKAA